LAANLNQDKISNRLSGQDFSYLLAGFTLIYYFASGGGQMGKELTPAG
jgi:hypothetical protein